MQAEQTKWIHRYKFRFMSISCIFEFILKIGLKQASNFASAEDQTAQIGLVFDSDGKQVSGQN